MKKVFFGLLIIAAGAGIFLYLRQQKKQSTIEQSLIIGSWKLDSLAFKKDSGGLQPNVFLFPDSNLLKYHYEFTKNNSILTSLQDSLTSDSARYDWATKKRTGLERCPFRCRRFATGYYSQQRQPGVARAG
jgi:hypothetical protein